MVNQQQDGKDDRAAVGRAHRGYFVVTRRARPEADTFTYENRPSRAPYSSRASTAYLDLLQSD
jgi:hypothetical protein